MKEGVLLKFSQNAMHKDKLLKTSPQILCEVCPYDTYWGSRLKINHSECRDMTKWVKIILENCKWKWDKSLHNYRLWGGRCLLHPTPTVGSYSLCIWIWLLFFLRIPPEFNLMWTPPSPLIEYSFYPPPPEFDIKSFFGGTALRISWSLKKW